MAKAGQGSHVKKPAGSKVEVTKILVDPKECPFREFRDNELSNEYWGMGTAAFRAVQNQPTGSKPTPNKMASPTTINQYWVDEQTQPLPSSIRDYLHEWVRAEDLAANRWDAEVVIFEDPRMTVVDTQLSHTQVLHRSTYCRKVLSACYILERTDFTVEHQWDLFTASFGPEGWRARYHIYAPGMKSGGGPQHRPTLSKNGCYLVRLYYLGAWRCIWVSDQVPVDANGSPLLPFSPLILHVATKPKQTPATVTSGVIHLWPLLLCKALLKLAAPEMSQINDDSSNADTEDEEMLDFDILHALTGCMSQRYFLQDPDTAWKLITSEVPVFGWDDDDDGAMSSTNKTRSTKKASAKESPNVKQRSMLSVCIEDSQQLPPYTLPGVSPGYSMTLVVTMARDVPLKKPLPEPEIPLWKTYRWLDWARSHGLYEAYDCPRTRFVRVNGLLKLSYAPHLLEVQSTESITMVFREEHSKADTKKKGPKDVKQNVSQHTMQTSILQKEEAREWVQFLPLQELSRYINILYYPSQFEYTSAASSPPQRLHKVPNKNLDIQAPKASPLYFSIDGPDDNYLKISLSVLHPRILLNCGVPIEDFIEKAHVLLEVFEWLRNTEIPLAKAYIQTRGYDAVEVCFKPGRHFCRLWVHSRTNWHVAMLSSSVILLGTRDVIQMSAAKECPWVSRFLNNLGVSFNIWMRSDKPVNMLLADKDFYQSYQPDLYWDKEVVGYNKALLHWMFRQALQSHLLRRLQPLEFDLVCNFLRKLFKDPDFGFPPKPKPSRDLREIISKDPCDCIIPVSEQLGEEEQHSSQHDLDERSEHTEHTVTAEEKLSPVDDAILSELLNPTSNVCELAAEEIPCGVLKEERAKLIRKYEAATLLQASWRGRWARKCLTTPVAVTSDVYKVLNDHAFGNLEALSALMNEFFGMYPGARYAYSTSSALSGSYGIHQYTGVALMTAKCIWVPYFQGVFYCHAYVKVHFDVLSSLEHSLVIVYDNDNGEQLPQAYNAHVTFEFEPNAYGYTVMGYGSVNKPTGVFHEVQWQLTVMASIDHVFHTCDNDPDLCTTLPLPGASKLHIDEFYIPNRRNILGGIQIAVSKVEAVSFRASATKTDLEIEAVLRSKTKGGVMEELARCKGKGDIFWPYIRLKPHDNNHSSLQLLSKKSYSQNNLHGSAPSTAKEKKDKTDAKLKENVDQDIPIITVHQPLPDDPYTELECSTSVGGGAFLKRDDDRDLLFAIARRSWEAKQPGRNMKGEEIRQEFREEFLASMIQTKPASTHAVGEEGFVEEYLEEESKAGTVQGPTPVSDTILEELEGEDEFLYYTMPDQLRDKFVSLCFVPLCTKELVESETLLLAPEMVDVAKAQRTEHLEAALERMTELQNYNDVHVLGGQKRRIILLEKLLVDGTWQPDLAEALEERDEAITREIHEATLTAKKKVQEAAAAKKIEVVKKKK
ncbi:uncharacterized protein LOC113239986 [Hyposmocoma kahamanoa]|uniref:uncharacterized protein LOC113239986 n=1 Tax=Hyposmocoma kahamanoa TaxID=1477025 RepID=UPI000E6D6AEA|nr:uncharacterized protein LOC113239986 [Hyposmocoma kahamanoa]